MSVYETENKNKGGMIVLLIFLLICSGLGIAAFAMSLTRCKKDGFVEFEVEENEEYSGTESEDGVRKIKLMRMNSPI